MAGTDELLRVPRDPRLEPLHLRFGYAQTLRPYGLEDARSYVSFHAVRAGGRADLVTEDAVRKLFNASHGRPRAINQLALQTLIRPAVEGRDRTDGAFVTSQIASHPVYDTTQEAM